MPKFTFPLLTVFFVLLGINAHTSPYKPCYLDKEKLASRSKEIAKLERADQKDRENWENKTQEERSEIATRDKLRRERIGQIFGEGCFNSAEDFNNAALIFQHGEVPDHYYQAFIWANKAVSMGQSNGKGMAAVAIDRYLVGIGKKQLFASQATMSDSKTGCICMEQVEVTFPDSERVSFGGGSLQDRINWVNQLNQGKNCIELECKRELSPSPKGTVPGFW